MKTKYDVIIVGAGPAGSTTALKIAAKNYDVLILDKASFPREKSCGDSLTRTATKTLYDLGLEDELLDFERTTSTKITVNKKGSRYFKYPDYMTNPKHGLVVPREKLDALLLKKAIGNGAFFKANTSFKSLIYKGEKVIGVSLENGDEFYADVVVGADGATSGVAYQAALVQTPIDKIGVGTRGYFKTKVSVDDTLQLFLPVLDHSNKRILPSYGWVFPVKEGVVNIGVGIIEKNEIHDIDFVFKMFIDTLKKKDSRFNDLELQGSTKQGAMRFDFKPERSYASGILLVGDAAGMINPFTGEGVGYALETGIHAANVYLELKENPNENFKDLSKYGTVLASKYQGYFEAGMASINRYHLIWKVLKGTFQNDKPLFKAIRQATVFPEGVNVSFFNYYTENVKDRIPENQGQIRTDMLTIGQNLIQMTREDWPFLSHIFTANQITHGIPFRPSLLVFIAGYGSKENRNELIKLGTAIELGLASTICHDSVSEENNDDDSMVNWGNMISILMGDYLLSKSFEIIAPLAHNYTHVISEAVGKSNEGTVLLKNALKEDEPITIERLIDLYYIKNTYAFELCLHLGGMVKKASQEDIGALKKYGMYYGAAYFFMEDIKAYFNQKESVSETVALRTLEQQLLQRLFLNKNRMFCFGLCVEVINRELDKARSQLLGVSDPWISLCLNNFCDLLQEKQQLINLKAL